MKSKRTVYLLLSIVLLIWGSVFYRLINPDESIKPVKSSTKATEGPVVTKNEIDEKLQLNYRDPFLSSAPKQMPVRKNVVSITKKLRDTSIVLPTKVPWPNVILSGLIVNNETSSYVALLKIDGKSKSLILGKAINELKFLKVEGRNITLSFKGEKKSLFAFVKTISA